ncbi:MAG: MmgE/PrpD family protein [Rhodospirillaceae bacterium]|nr:MmgE/PrpD family protein [Rhodospirillaceae bacterium]
MIAAKLAAHAASLVDAELDDAVLHAAKRCVLDTFAATICGAVNAPATLMTDALEEELDHGNSGLVPSGRLAPIRTAALINAAAAHAMEVDDIFRDGIYHPGPPVIPAALAACQGRGMDGERFLRAVIAGYEVSNRVAAAMQPMHYKFWHTTGTIGTIGAAAAVSVALGLDAAATKDALANSVTMAAALQQAFATDSMGKPIHAGHASEAGAMAAIVAEKGVTGGDGIFEGPTGIGRAMSYDVDWEAMTDTLDKEFTICRMTQKNHTCCGHTFAAIDAVLALKEAHGLTPDDVEAITVGTYAKGVEICGTPDPKTLYEAKFSLEYVMAAALVTGRVRFAAFTDELLADPVMRANMAKIKCHVDDAAEAAFPSRRSAVVEITTKDGQTLEHYSPTRKGDPDNPLSDAELEDKYRELSEPVIGVDAAEALRQRVWEIDKVDDLRTLFA